MFAHLVRTPLKATVWLSREDLSSPPVRSWYTAQLWLVLQKILNETSDVALITSEDLQGCVDNQRQTKILWKRFFSDSMRFSTLL